ncbi:MAG: hypothetical protein LBV17_05750 [Treponema sp.]|jgi:hypothetical protein|nr:hypothetical protein [Treponema sp.]
MKKIMNLFVLCFLFFSTPLFAQDDKITWNNGDDGNIKVTPDKDVVWTNEVSEKKKTIAIEKEKGLVRVPDRKFEIGLANFGLGFSNDFMTTFEIFKEKVKIDLDKFSDGFNVNANFAVNPIYISYNKNDVWGIGVNTGLDLIGLIGLNGNMLTFHETGSAESDIGAAVFSEVKIQSFFTYEKIKLKIKPTLYYPIIYAEPSNFTYTYTNKNIDGVEKTVFNLALDMRVYTALKMDDDFDIAGIIGNIDNMTARPGVDISIGAEYPLSEALGINKKYDFLDFDVGIDFINIPLYPSDMEDYRRMIVNIGSDEPMDFFTGKFGDTSEGNDINNFYNYEFEDYGKKRKNVFRPFKMLISANWRPFYKPSPQDTDEWLKRKKEWLVFIPTIGFTVNPLYFQPVSVEGGIKTCLSLANLVIVSLDIGYHDRLWKNGLDLALNFMLFEIDFGANMQSPRFLKSWTGGGFGATFRFKIGF